MISVSSPATVPRTAGSAGPVERRADDVGRARRRAQHDEVARRRHLDHPVAEDPAQVVVGRPLVLGQLGDGVDRLPVRAAHLDGPEVVEVARHGRLGGRDAFAGEQVDELLLAADAVLGQQLGHEVLALGLGQPHGPVGRRSPIGSLIGRPARPARRGRRGRRLAASGHTRLRGPSITSAATSSPRWAGRQCRKMRVGGGSGHEGAVDGEAGERLARRCGLVLLAHRVPRCRSRRRRRPRRPSPARSRRSTSAAPVAARRSRSTSDGP